MEGKVKRDSEENQAKDAAAAAYGARTSASAAASGGRASTAPHQGGAQGTLASHETDKPVSELHPELTAQHKKVMREFFEFDVADDYRGVVNLKVEASEIAAIVRKADPSSAAHLYLMIGDNHEKVGKSDSEKLQLYRDAIGFLELSKCIYEEIRDAELASNHKTNDRRYLRDACFNLASCYRQIGCFEKALVLNDRALVIAEEEGDRQVLGLVMANQGSLHRQLGQHSTAILLLEQALTIVKEEEGDSFAIGAFAHTHKYTQIYTLTHNTHIHTRCVDDASRALLSRHEAI
jgi:tetratricopeptide (TPR) repeat protein